MTHPAEGVEWLLVVDVEDLEVAGEITTSCPLFEIGELEVAELPDMTPK